MAQERRRGSSHDPKGVVHSLRAAADRSCVRPGCSTPAGATLSFAYRLREVVVDRLSDEAPPQSYDLCATHAARTRPPHGWVLRDRRPDDGLPAP